MIHLNETQSKETIKKAIESRVDSINYLQRMLPYADHGAYGQDLQRIADYEDEIAQLKRALAVASGEIV
jgi:hypothetical protein